MRAYLDTTPEKSDQPRREGWTGGMPDAGPLLHLIGPLFEIGPVVSMGQSARPVQWLDIAGWQQATGDELTPWEATALIDLSDAYLSQHYRSYKQDALAPWADTSRIDHAALAERRKQRHANG